MKIRAASGIMLTLLLTGMLTLAFNIQPVKASGTVYIRADGSVEGTDKIQRDGDIYTLTDSIYDSIVVERDNIVADGAGYTLQGTGVALSKGIYLSERSNVTIKNMEIRAFYYGIELFKSSNNIIQGNNITNNVYGIGLYTSSNHNSIHGNNITNNCLATKLYWSSNNHFYHNNFTDNSLQVSIEPPGSPSVWDIGYPSGGNYWSDYTGADADGDEIGDTQHVIDENNRDRYPLWGLPPPPFWTQWWFWTIIAAGIVVTAIAVYFLKKRLHVGIVILLWSVLMVLLFFYPFFIERFGQKVSFSLWSGYMLVTSLLLTKFFEKRGITERFGLQRNNALGLLVVTCLGFLVVRYFDLNELLNSNALEVIVFVPLLEEIFYRGYMLGTLCKRDHNEWRPNDLVWTIFTSLLFALGHIFNTHPRASILNIFVGSLSLGFLYVRFKTILWCFLVHMLYNLSVPFGITYLYFHILVIFSAIILLTYFLKITGLSKLTRTSHT